MNASTRVVVNTAVVYIKLLIGIALGLFTTRLVLEALGETDYGVFILVGGMIGMLAILNSSMSNGSMRFMAHSLGSGDPEKIRLTFNTTLHLHIIIGLLLILIMEIGGYFMFRYIINIPEGRFFAAQFVFHSMVLTTFVTIVSVPYDAVINAHENLLFLSVVDVLGYILKLGLAIYLFYAPYDLLITYATILLAIHIIQRLIKQIYSRRKYDECKVDFSNYKNKKLRNEILSFSGWNLFGSIASMSVTQIRSLILNVFFGVDINAAEGVSKTASNQLNTVSSSMTRALNPQLVKSEGSGNRRRMLMLTEISTKFSGFLFAIFAIPAIIEMPFLIDIWLKNVPDFAIAFTRLILIGLLLEKFTFEITNAIRANGNIRAMTIMESVIAVITIPAAIFIFQLGYKPYWIFIIYIISTLLAAFNRFYYAKKILDMKIKIFFFRAILPVIFPLSVIIVLNVLVNFINNNELIRLSVSFILTPLLFVFLFWVFSMTKEEKMKIKEIAGQIREKLKSVA
ncbi:MAG: MATE family efflux transporter [Brumimicrobium sp.]|nr:MATE family efflux transporter [Brumimicrobium sp.]